MKIRILNREFRFSPSGLVVYILLSTLLCGLGFWQLDRSEQKKQILQQQQTAALAESIDLNQEPITDSSAVRYQKVRVAGRYDDSHPFLIDNQVVDGKPGFFVLTPFVIEQEKRAVLVNRGWIALGSVRSKLPDVSIKTNEAVITGRINRFPAVGIKLKGAEIPTDGWPALVQVVDNKVLAARLAYDLYDFQIELDTDAPEGFRREWKSNAVSPPEKNLAYAVQWFGMALTLTVLFFLISSRKPK